MDLIQSDPSESVYPSSNVRSFNMSSVIFLFACSSLSIFFRDFSFDLIDFNTDTILERLFSFKILMSGIWFLMIIFSLLLSSCSFLLFLWYMWPCLSLDLLFSLLLKSSPSFSDSASLQTGFSSFFQFGDISFSPY